MPAYTRCPDCNFLTLANGRCTHWSACDQCGELTDCADTRRTTDYTFCSDACLYEAGLETAAEEAPEAWERAL